MYFQSTQRGEHTFALGPGDSIHYDGRVPHAIDNDQLRNAESFAVAGAGWIRPQAGLEPAEFAAFLTRLRYQESELKQAAQAALSHGRPDAAQRLADLAERIAGKQTT